MNFIIALVGVLAIMWAGEACRQSRHRSEAARWSGKTEKKPSFKARALAYWEEVKAHYSKKPSGEDH